MGYNQTNRASGFVDAPKFSSRTFIELQKKVHFVQPAASNPVFIDSVLLACLWLITNVPLNRVVSLITYPKGDVPRANH